MRQTKTLLILLGLMWSTPALAQFVPVDVNVARVSGAVTSATNPLFVQLTDGSMALALAEDGVVGEPAPSGGPQMTCRFADFDASALPTQADVEGDSTACITTAVGAQYVVIVNEDGSLERGTSTTPFQVQSAGSALATQTTLAAILAANALTPSTCTGIIGGASVNQTAIKGSAGVLTYLSAFSLDATPVYIKLYNDTTGNIDEMDTPVIRLMAPSAATASLGGGFVNLLPPGGMTFSTAITLRATTGIVDSSTGALTADEVLINWCYQ